MLFFTSQETPRQDKQTRYLFEKFDTDKSGSLDVSQLKACLEEAAHLSGMMYMKADDEDVAHVLVRAPPIYAPAPDFAAPAAATAARSQYMLMLEKEALGGPRHGMGRAARALLHQGRAPASRSL